MALLGFWKLEYMQVRPRKNIGTPFFATVFFCLIDNWSMAILYWLCSIAWHDVAGPVLKKAVGNAKVEDLFDNYCHCHTTPITTVLANNNHKMVTIIITTMASG